MSKLKTMEWAVPLQKIDVNKINVGHIRYGEKPLAPLAYYDGPIHLPSVNILLPALLVKDYDPQTGRLKLSIQDNGAVLHTLSSLPFHNPTPLPFSPILSSLTLHCIHIHAYFFPFPHIQKNTRYGCKKY